MWCLVTIGGSTSLGFIRHSASRWSGCTSGACVYHIVAHGTQHGTPQCARVHRESVMNCTRQCTENQGSTKHRVAPLRITIGESRHSACDTSTRCRVEMFETRNALSRVVLAVGHFIVEIMYYCTACTESNPGDVEVPRLAPQWFVVVLANVPSVGKRAIPHSILRCMRESDGRSLGSNTEHNWARPTPALQFTALHFAPLSCIISTEPAPVNAWFSYYTTPQYYT